MILTRLSMALASGGTARFNPAYDLFRASEQGMWYDLNDDSTIFQDSAGTTLASWGDPVGLVLDKHEGLAQGAELVTNGTFTTDTNWTKAAGVTISGGVANFAAVNAADALFQNCGITAGRTYLIECDITGVGTVSANFGGNAASGATRGAGRASWRLTATSGANGNFIFYAQSFTGTIDNVTVKSIAGNHAIQSTSGVRPILGRMPKRGAVNLVVSSEDVSATAWTKGAVTTPDAFTIVESASSASHFIFRDGVANVSGLPYTQSVTLAKGSLATAPDIMQLSFGGAGFGAGQYANVNVLTGAVVATAGGATCTSAADPNVVGGWRFSYTATATANANSAGVLVYFCNNNPAATRAPSYTGSVTSDCKVYRMQTEQNSVATAYQHVIDSLGFNVTESGQPSCGYLSYNGTNQWMQTAASVDFSATDEMSVFVGVRKVSDAASGSVAALTTLGGSTNGSFNLLAPSLSGANSYRYQSRGTTTDVAGTGVFAAAPDYAVLTGTSDISSPVAILRRNGAIVESATNTQGTGNFSNAVVYFGTQGGVSTFFNGLMFSTIIRGALTSGTLLTRTEQYVARQTPTVNL